MLPLGIPEDLKEAANNWYCDYIESMEYRRNPRYGRTKMKILYNNLKGNLDKKIIICKLLLVLLLYYYTTDQSALICLSINFFALYTICVVSILLLLLIISASSCPLETA